MRVMTSNGHVATRVHIVTCTRGKVCEGVGARSIQCMCLLELLTGMYLSASVQVGAEG